MKVNTKNTKWKILIFLPKWKFGRSCGVGTLKLIFCIRTGHSTQVQSSSRWGPYYIFHKTFLVSPLAASWVDGSGNLKRNLLSWRFLEDKSVNGLFRTVGNSTVRGISVFTRDSPLGLSPFQWNTDRQWVIVSIFVEYCLQITLETQVLGMAGCEASALSSLQAKGHIQ